MGIHADVIRFITVKVEQHETEPSAQMRKSDRDERSDRPGGGFRGERGGFRGGDRAGGGGFRGGGDRGDRPPREGGFRGGPGGDRGDRPPREGGFRGGPGGDRGDRPPRAPNPTNAGPERT